MTATDVMNMIILDGENISAAISTGASWEIWMQVELVFLFNRQGCQTAREVTYPHPYNSLRLDLLVKDRTGTQAGIELKVESATNAGAAVLVNALEDVVKIRAYSSPGTTDRWVISIGYSDAAKAAMKEYAATPANNAIYQQHITADSFGNVVGGIGCMIISV